MDKQKQIEEMAKIICKEGANNGDCDKCGFHRQCSKFKVAEKLYNAGYRKESETAEKFSERLKEELENRSAVVGYDLEDLEFDGEIIQECIDEICKEFTGKYND
jgi:hypothetical protein